MNKFKSIFLLITVFFIVGKGLAFAKDTLNIPEPRGFVNDFEGVLGNDSQSLETYLEKIHNETGVEIAVVTVDDFEGYDIDTFASKLFEQWEIGNKDADNGILILISIKQRQARIEVGYGLEGALPDSYVGLVGEKYLIPSLKSGNYVEGITVTVDQLIKRVRDENYVLPKEDSDKSQLLSEDFMISFLVTAVSTMFFTLLFSSRDKYGLQGFFIGLFMAFSFLGSLRNPSLIVVLFFLFSEGVVGMLTSFFIYHVLGISSKSSVSSSTRKTSPYYSHSWSSSSYSSSSSSSSGGSFSFGGGSSGGGGASWSW